MKEITSYRKNPNSAVRGAGTLRYSDVGIFSNASDYISISKAVWE